MTMHFITWLNFHNYLGAEKFLPVFFSLIAICGFIEVIGSISFGFAYYRISIFDPRKTSKMVEQNSDLKEICVDGNGRIVVMEQQHGGSTIISILSQVIKCMVIIFVQDVCLYVRRAKKIKYDQYDHVPACAHSVTENWGIKLPYPLMGHFWGPNFAVAEK